MKVVVDLKVSHVISKVPLRHVQIGCHWVKNTNSCNFQKKVLNPVTASERFRSRHFATFFLNWPPLMPLIKKQTTGKMFCIIRMPQTALKRWEKSSFQQKCFFELKTGGKSTEKHEKASEIDSKSITADHLECMADEPVTVWTQKHSNYCKDRLLNELGNLN